MKYLVSNKCYIIALITMMSFSISTFAQEDKKELIYRVGVGPVIDGDIGMFGINIMNELTFRMTDRFSINPSLTYYSSLGYIESRQFFSENPDFQDQSFSSSLFTDVRFQYDVIRTNKGFRLGLAAGPSFQLGGHTYYSGAWVNDVIGSFNPSGYATERFKRLGYVTQVTFDWKTANPNRRNTIAVSMSSFDNYWPYYLMVNYRLGFKIR
ncbi:hypothetical protein [Cecembia sp.]|uniref:hypothetical protein n=1 Tax=Cecembia sp. TaxID=1898110 RepID=UPI0025B8A80A|nr:hypothetical protein [Cecembia sp.]